jgi:hypothetical protein
MKTLISGLFLLMASIFSQNASAGLNLVCETHDVHRHFLAYGQIVLDCSRIGRDEVTSDNHDYAVIISGVGPGLQLDLGTRAIVSCPTVSKKRLDRKGYVYMASATVSATAIAGATAGVAINHRGGACFIAGAQLGLGASAKIGGFTILNSSHDFSHQSDLDSFIESILPVPFATF